MEEPNSSPTFSADALHRLVDAALAIETPSGEGGSSELARHSSTDVSPIQTHLPWTSLNYQLFHSLYNILNENTSIPNAQAILDSLRSEISHQQRVVALPQLHTQVKACRRCTTVKPSPCLPTGNLHSPTLLIIHDHPYGYSDLTGLNSVISVAGFDAREAAHTAIARCEPNDSRSPSEQEIINCREFLFAEIQSLQPKLIVLLGSNVLHSFVPDSSITAERGKVFWLGQWAFLPTYAYGYTRKRESAQVDMAADFTLAYQFCYGSSKEVMHTSDKA